jgi:hypothetical protein
MEAADNIKEDHNYLGQQRIKLDDDFELQQHHVVVDRHLYFDDLLPICK